MIRKLNIPSKLYEFAIIGGGPSGLLAFKKLKLKFNLNDADVVLFEKDKKVCERLEHYGKFVKNHGSIGSEKWNFLVSGKYNGMDIAKYFRKRYVGNYIFSKIKKISKFSDKTSYLLEAENGNTYCSKQVILATGTKSREISAIIKHKNNTFDYTNSHAEDLKHINFSKNQLILIGSGDNVLFKANKIARYIDEKYRNLKYVPITIFVKEKINDSANPLFIYENKKHVQKKLINIVNNCWDIEEIQTNRFGLVNNLVSRNGIRYQVAAPGGAFLSVHIGNEADIPELGGCEQDDFIKVGDISLFLSKLPLSITGALQNVEDQLS